MGAELRGLPKQPLLIPFGAVTFAAYEDKARARLRLSDHF
jgi:hypothetical protein